MADASPNLSCTETNQLEPGGNIEADLQKILNGQHVPVNHIAVGLDRIGKTTGGDMCSTGISKMCGHYFWRVPTQTLTPPDGKVLLESFPPRVNE